MTNLRAVHLYNTSICANDTPALDPAFDDLVESGVLSCEEKKETAPGAEYESLDVSYGYADSSGYYYYA